MVRNVFTEKPDQSSFSGGKGVLSPEQVDKFFEDGYLLLEDVYDINEELEPCRKATEHLVEESVAQKLFKGGKITDTYPKADLFHRLTLLNKAYEGATVLIIKSGDFPKAYSDIWMNPKMLGVMEQLIGKVDIAGNPIWRVRPKVPGVALHEVPWHQDSAYFEEAASKVINIAAWIPLLDTNVQNGCMQVVRGAQKAGKVAKHWGCWADTWHIWTNPEDMERDLGVDMKKDVVTCEVPYGGVLLFSNLMPHRSLPNVADEIRWSLDFRYQDGALDVGFYGVKDNIIMKRQNDPNYVPDFDAWNRIDRNEKQLELVGAKLATEDPLGTTRAGPWMNRWPLVNRNRHTESLRKS